MKIKDPNNVKIMYDSVLVKVEKKQEKKNNEKFEQNEAGIYVPKTAVPEVIDPFKIGVVVVAGSGYTTPDGVSLPLRTKVGDCVVFDNRNGANNVVFESGDPNFEYRLIREQNILMVIDVEAENKIVEEAEKEDKTTSVEESKDEGNKN